MNKMLTFDSFTLIPKYSDIESRNEVDISTDLCGIKSEIPVINANMLAICTKNMVDSLYNNNTISSYHRFFESESLRDETTYNLKNYKDKLFISLGTKKEEYSVVEKYYNYGFRNFIIDVNHGHHKMVGEIAKFIKTNFNDIILMGGNVSSVDGVLFLQDFGADIVKIGNSFGGVCETLIRTGYGSHPLDTAIKYDKFVGSYSKDRVKLCLDGGIRNISDIAKSLIFGDIVMLGKMFAGSNESAGEVVSYNGTYKTTYYGNASLKAKKDINKNNVKYIEGTTKLVDRTGPLETTLNSIKEGLQSSFSFVGARNLKEYKRKAKDQLLMV